MSSPASRCALVLTVLTALDCGGPISDFPNGSDNGGPISDFPHPPSEDAGVDPCACQAVDADGGVPDGGVHCQPDADESTTPPEQRKPIYRR